MECLKTECLIAGRGIEILIDKKLQKKCSWQLLESKSAKYANLDTHYRPSFQPEPVAIETLGPINGSAGDFLSNLQGRKISLQSGDDREASFLFQRISVSDPAVSQKGDWRPFQLLCIA